MVSKKRRTIKEKEKICAYANSCHKKDKCRRFYYNNAKDINTALKICQEKFPVFWCENEMVCGFWMRIIKNDFALFFIERSKDYDRS
jgi:hypothetical protein